MKLSSNDVSLSTHWRSKILVGRTPTKELIKYVGMNFEPLSLSRFFPPALFNPLLREIRAFSQHENESLTDAWLCMKEMLRNCHGHNMSKGNIIKICKMLCLICSNHTKAIENEGDELQDILIIF
ncbi:hypothetical protein Tco_1155257 [Tanacetum coccineum]